MQSVFQAVQALFSGLFVSDKANMPIGLSQVNLVSEEDVFNHLSRPATGIPLFSPSISQRKKPHAAPAFARVAPAVNAFQYPQISTSRLTQPYTRL